MGILRKTKVDAIRDYLNQGFTDVEIAAKAKVSRYTVGKYRRELVQDRPPPVEVKDADGYALSKGQLRRVDLIDHLESGRDRSKVIDGLLDRDARVRRLLDDPRRLSQVV